ncbi:uncharacterized protein EAE98_005310 [Botrytis deweyae]|uniref:Uncharacterized protein n=1 Tax=Botrytis deweyae TaxID=2478750 RepID=A0ABQ7INJ9_9HELO|nr:uncharacterized protein EAE98_005310 [Botrytis deweyae]KAF7929392.1 hypothetical protein EAE98_005310 [Botrytis deweyae]
MIRVPANVGAQNPPILNSPDTFKSTKNNIPALPDLTSSCIYDEINSTTGDIIDSTKNNIPALPDLPSSCIYDEINSTTGDIIDSTKKRDELPRIRADVNRRLIEFSKFGAKLNAVATEIRDFYGAHREQTRSSDEFLAKMDNDIARLREPTEEVDEMASLVKRNMELELKVYMQSTKLKKLEGWSVEMRRMVSKWDAE